MKINQIIKLAQKHNEQINIIGRTGTGSALKNIDFLIDLENEKIFYDLEINGDKLQIYF